MKYMFIGNLLEVYISRTMMINVTGLCVVDRPSYWFVNYVRLVIQIILSSSPMLIELGVSQHLFTLHKMTQNKTFTDWSILSLFQT